MSANTEIYGEIQTPKKIFIIFHGLSGGPNNDLISYLANEIPKNIEDSIAITYSFEFFRNNTSPSEDLSKEAEEIKSIYDEVNKKYKNFKLFFIGKSIGGVVSLIFNKKYPNSNVKTFILGWPMKLGYPLRLHLLNEDNPKLPNYLDEYKDILESLNESITFIQGDSDDLGDIKDCKTLLNKTTHKLNIINGANHSFLSVIDDRNYFKNCLDLLVSNS